MTKLNNKFEKPLNKFKFVGKERIIVTEKGES